MLTTELQAGRALDALVAEKVMGWERREPDNSQPYLKDPPDNPGRFHRKCVWYKDGERQACEECGSMPEFSTSIAAAWEVVEKIGEHYSWTLHLLGGPNEQKFYRLWIAGQTLSNELNGETAPLAICKAAMKWAERKET